jgi:phosphomannomutase
LFEETLTGFKWMGNRSAALRSEGYDVVFAYEEAIGYCVGDLVLDKDGVCAAAVMGEIVGFLRESETTLAEHLAKLYDTYGYFVNRNSYVKIHDKGALDSIFSKLRSPAYPSTLAGFKIKSVRDLTTGFDSAQPDNKATLPSDPSSHFLTLTMESGAVVSLRTSGTEPKLKYVEVLQRPPPPLLTPSITAQVLHRGQVGQRAGGAGAVRCAVGRRHG